MSAKVVINRCYGGFGLSDKAKGWLQAKGLTEDQIDVLCEECRHHPLLVECVETLKEKANDRFSDLCVIELRDDITEYVLREYDGWEAIETIEDFRHQCYDVKELPF